MVYSVTEWKPPEGFEEVNEEENSWKPPKGFEAVSSPSNEDYSDIQKRYLQSYEEQEGKNALQRMEGRRKIYSEAEEIARKNLGIKGVPNRKQKDKFDAEVDRILGKSGIGGGGIIPRTSEEIGKQREKGRAAAKGFTSGITLGSTKHFEGEIPEEDRTAYAGGEFLGETLLLSPIFKGIGIGKQISPASPAGKVVLNTAKDVLKMIGVGAGLETSKEAISGKIPDPGKVLSHGLTWGALDVVLKSGGVIGKTLINLFRKAAPAKEETISIVSKISDSLRQKGINPDKVEAVGEEAINLLKEREKRLSSDAAKESEMANNLKNKKVSKIEFDKITEKIPHEPTKPEVEIPPEVEINSKVSESELDALARRVDTKQQLGKEIQSGINKNLKAIKKEYKAAYDLFEESTIGTEVNANSVVKELWDEFSKLTRNFKTKPADYENTGKVLQNIMEDLGAILEYDKNGIPIAFYGTNPIPMSKMTEIGRRTGKIGKWGTTQWNIREKISSANRLIKKEIRESVKDNNDLLDIFNEAERIYSDRVNIYDNPTISKIRKKDYRTEDVSKLLDKPTDLERLKAAVPNSDFIKLERELLHQLNEMKYDKASDLIRELKPHMTSEGKVLADRILTQNKPISQLTKKDLKARTEDWITREFAKPGKPNSVIKYWESLAGRKDIKDALKNNPNKKEIIQYLEQEKFYRSADKFISQSGSLEYKQLSEFLKDKMNRETMKELVGKDGLAFLDFLTANKRRISLIEKVTEKMRSMPLKNFQPTKGKGDAFYEKMRVRIEKEKFPLITTVGEFFDNLPNEDKMLLKVIAMFKFGVFKTVTAVKAKDAILNIAKNPKIRNAIRQGMKYHNNPWKVYTIFKGTGSKPENKNKK